jgi:Skp family chaperone for outer membrane proteins
MYSCILRTLFLASFFCFVISPVYAQDAAKQTVIAVVDIEKILEKSKAAVSVQGQVSEKRKSFLTEVETAEKSLRETQKAIEKESKTLSKEELMKKAQEFETKRLDARKSIQEKKGKLDAAYTEAMNLLTKNIYEVCQKIADEQKIDLVITRQNIIVGNMALDITAEVLKRMDESLPTLDLKVK